jgi:hypothetical protein
LWGAVAARVVAGDAERLEGLRLVVWRPLLTSGRLCGCRTSAGVDLPLAPLSPGAWNEHGVSSTAAAVGAITSPRFGARGVRAYRRLVAGPAHKTPPRPATVASEEPERSRHWPGVLRGWLRCAAVRRAGRRTAQRAPRRSTIAEELPPGWYPPMRVRTGGRSGRASTGLPGSTGPPGTRGASALSPILPV